MASSDRTRRLCYAAFVLCLWVGLFRGTSARNPSCIQMERTTRDLLNQIPYPRSLEIVLNSTLPKGFAPNVRGRVTPLGVFEDAEGAIEYFYGLAVGQALRNPGAVPTSAMLRVDVRYMSCDRKSRIVSYSSNVTPGNPQTGELRPVSYRQVGFYKFNNKGQVCAYDWALLRLGLTVGNNAQDAIQGIETANSTVAASLAAKKAAGIQQLCGGIQALCKGNNTQYGGDFNRCVSFMNNITYGTWDNADQNTVVCRQLHLILAQIRPDMHCKHTGEDGGGKCVDKGWVEVFEDDFTTCRE